MRITLARLTLLVWSAWLLGLIAVVWVSYARTLHPDGSWVGILSMIQKAGVVAVLIGGTWRVIRGPRRWRAVMWMVWSVLPTLWTMSFNEYLAARQAEGSHTLNLLERSTVAGALLTWETYARAHYPCRHEGERFVMWSDSPECDAKEMAAMDAHLRSMEQELGQRSPYKVYWVRGPVCGNDGKYWRGWALGSAPGAPSIWDELNNIDLHETAHFALDQLLPSSLEVPMVLLEGWAECHSGSVFSDVSWRYAWKIRQKGQWLSLRELTSPHWYHDGTEPVHWQGRVLVDYLLRRFGSQKFLELCQTCRQATFADDLERVLGVSIDTLDKAYQQDLAEQGPPDRRFLLSATLGCGVNPSQWRRFVDDYYSGVERLRNSFRQSSVMMVQNQERMEQGGKEKTSQMRFEYYRDNEREASIDFRFADVVTPDYVFMLDKEESDGPWRMVHYQAQGPRKTFDLWTVVPSDPWFLRDALEPLQSQDRPRGLTITAIQSRDADSPRTRVFYERDPDSGSSSHGERGWWDLDPQRDYAVVESTREDFDESGAVTYSMNTTVQYEIVEGHLVPQRVHRKSKLSDGTSLKTIGIIESCRFETPPHKTFELATYGDLYPKPPVTIKPASRRGIIPWIAGGCSLLALAMAGFQIRRRSTVGVLSLGPSGIPAFDGQATSPPETETHTDPHR